MPRNPDPPAGAIHTMLEPSLAGEYWTQVARYLQPRCDRFWIHWWFRPPNDTRPIFDQLLNPAGRPPDEPLPPQRELALGRLAWLIDGIEPSWICPNGAAATGPLTADTLAILLEQTDVPWWDLHLYSRGHIRFVATDGGDEHFAWLFAEDFRAMAAAGIPEALFRRW